MSERYSSFRRGGRRWLFQRITAGLLIVILAFHFFLLHFVNHAADIRLAGTTARMSTVGYFLTMELFLMTAAFHGVNGVYNALVNMGLSGTRKRAVKYVLALAGVLLIAQGTRVAVAMSDLV
ncbi:succinate dehydrogenase [Halobacteriales archaeon SW_7_68_16]|nr:MAG: succinate dehydrogenase [Halobacteriales archaeon SW_7_68_16]